MGKVFLLIFVLAFLPGVIASVGVSPSSYEINFEPLLEEEFVFDFQFGSGQKAEIYVEGSLADFLSVDKSGIVGRETVRAKLNLPWKIETPGAHYLYVGARQPLVEGKGIGMVANVRGIIKINVPYPGKYVEVEAYSLNADVGEIVNLTMDFYNKGEEEATVLPIVQIFKGSSLIERFELDQFNMSATGYRRVYAFVNTTGYTSGDYTATIIADHGGEKFSRADSHFRLGEFKVIILNHTTNVGSGGLRPFLIDVESRSNNLIESVYAVVRVVDFEFIEFRTPSISLDSFERGTLEGYLDTSYDLGEMISLEIVLHYGEFKETKLTYLDILISKKYHFYLISIVFMTILVGIFFRFFILVRRMKSRKI